MEQEHDIEFYDKLIDDLHRICHTLEDKRDSVYQVPEDELLPQSRKLPFTRLIKKTDGTEDKRYYFRYRRVYLQIMEEFDKLEKAKVWDEETKQWIESTRSIITLPRSNRQEILQDALEFARQVLSHTVEHPQYYHIPRLARKLHKIAEEAVEEFDN